MQRSFRKQGTFRADEAVEIERYCTRKGITESDLIREATLKAINYKPKK